LKSLLANEKNFLIDKLQKEVLLLEGYKPATVGKLHLPGLQTIEAAFPNGIFPLGAVHEFLTFEPEHSAATGGFISGILSGILSPGGVCIWVSNCRCLFPPALKAFGLQPDNIIFIDVHRERDVLAATEEALKCNSITAVIAEIGELTFMQSRRLQLAVEASKVTGFIMRNNARRITSTACISRWQVIPQPGAAADGLPGVGYPRWQVALQRVRNGRPGNWTVEWRAGKFAVIEESRFRLTINKHIRQAG